MGVVVAAGALGSTMAFVGADEVVWVIVVSRITAFVGISVAFSWLTAGVWGLRITAIVGGNTEADETGSGTTGKLFSVKTNGDVGVSTLAVGETIPGGRVNVGFRTTATVGGGTATYDTGSGIVGRLISVKTNGDLGVSSWIAVKAVTGVSKRAFSGVSWAMKPGGGGSGTALVTGGNRGAQARGSDTTENGSRDGLLLCLREHNCWFETRPSFTRV